MQVPFFQVDAFTTRRFAGNPAAVMLLDAFPDDAVLTAIAAENNLSETAFLVREGADYRLRWFTPKVEVPLCGHATLASAAVVMERLEPSRDSVTFQTLSGALPVVRAGGGYLMDFPARPSAEVPVPAALEAAIGLAPLSFRKNDFTAMAVVADAGQVRTLAPDLAAIAMLDRPGLIVTAPGDGPHDVVSRYFAPARGIPEDPVTGSAHSTIVPYWAERLGKTTLRAHQASARGGDLLCRLEGERVMIEGACVFVIEGMAEY
ncbi:PhzF family phenazine biosynthesis protein [Xanthobacteraceae bacterium A53D]